MYKMLYTHALIVWIALFFVAGCERIQSLWATADAQENPPSERPPPGSSPPPQVSPAAAAAPDWCPGHAIPESMCTKCNPELIATFQQKGDWCAGHGFPESACPLCNPAKPPAPKESQTPSPTADWCAEHFVPESKCTKCNVDLVASFQEKGDWCAEHGFPESVCPTCNPVKAPPGFPVGPFDAQTVRFASPDMERIADIQTVLAVDKQPKAVIESTARIDFNQNLTAEVRASVPGIVREVSIDLGQLVTQGDPIFVLESAHIGDLQARRQAANERFKVAKANLSRQEGLRSDNIASSRQVELARQEHELAEAELRSIDQSLKLAGTIKTGAPGRFQVTAPISGTVIRRPARIGTSAADQEPLAVISNTQHMWALIEVNEWDASSLRLQQPVSLRVDGILDRDFQGTISWISPEVDPRSRAVTVRAELPNPDGLLRAHQFGRAQIQVSSSSAPLVAIPTNAIQHIQDISVVFVRREPGVYESKQIQIDRSDGPLTYVQGALRAGDPVVTSGAFLLRTELDKESIGAGCAGDH